MYCFYKILNVPYLISTSGTTNGNISTHPIKWMGVSSSTSAVQTSFSLDYKHSSTHEESMNNNNGMLNSQKETFQDHPFKRKINGTNLSLGSKKSSILLNHQVDSDFIIKSRLSKAREDKESIDKLRKIIKNELNITLPNDLGGALRDGILLCQLMNHLYPQSLVNIDMPSVTMPRLSVTKCRWNVENFLSSCEKTGVTKKDLFKWEEIVLQKEVTKVAHTVQILSSLCANKPKTVKPCCEFYLSWLLLGLLIGTCLLIILYPPPP
ncbi:leucine-rich repeat and calponin homology domain-containing protein 1-like [Limulus polyphemus]|uniref:Leucine-rich repeat and calponin homology domain-containing protein 1-like n=1 Tax=Limulus polyphemus TaxID=6850 RepID=A0ABM1TLW0_LIMPO|nr:leucine-rich repeat and calponin homology domain-containing protein 1-like [Limulus polyphemus]